jgi:hypothetical protein
MVVDRAQVRLIEQAGGILDHGDDVVDVDSGASREASPA